MLNRMRGVKHSRLIAAYLLFAMLSWVGSLALPMAPAGHASHAARGGHGSGMVMEHPCCPRPSRPMMPEPAAPAPTGDLHRCCFLRAPEAPPAGNQKNVAQQPTANEKAPVDSPHAAAQLRHTSFGQSSPEPALRWLSEASVVLRI